MGLQPTFAADAAGKDTRRCRTAFVNMAEDLAEFVMVERQGVTLCGASLGTMGVTKDAVVESTTRDYAIHEKYSWVPFTRPITATCACGKEMFYGYPWRKFFAAHGSDSLAAYEWILAQLREYPCTFVEDDVPDEGVLAQRGMVELRARPPSNMRVFLASIPPASAPLPAPLP